MHDNDPIIRNLRIVYCKTSLTLKGFKEVLTRVGNTPLELPVRQRFDNWEEVQALLYLECMNHYPHVFDTSDPRIENCPDWYEFKKMAAFGSESDFHKIMHEGDKKALKGFKILYDKEDLPTILEHTVKKCIKLLSHTKKFALSEKNTE
ncbi:hypothetical protein [Mariniflexile sp.]|uniref:hypothetical protein n=1 Tax=Mariniflexile sp. TaxID=1979402 RepID=UPI0040473072